MQWIVSPQQFIVPSTNTPQAKKLPLSVLICVYNPGTVRVIEPQQWTD